MIDTETTFSELTNVLKHYKRWRHIQPTDFFSRPSFARYLEEKPDGKGFKKIYQWIWMDKIGIKDNQFYAHLNSFGIMKDASLLNDKQFNATTSKKLAQILKSYSDFLGTRLDSIVKNMNRKKITF